MIFYSSLFRKFLLLVFTLNIYILNAQIIFENQADALGVGIAYGYGFLGGGVSFFDYNQDGLDDITISTASGTDFLFFKNVNGVFEQDFLAIDGGNLQTKQVIWVDYDNDGDYDFFAASDEGPSKLFKNNGDETFTDITASSGLPIDNYETFGGSWGDYNNDGFLDVFLSIRDVSLETPNLLFRNNGDGTFTDVTISAGLETTGYITFCAAFFDYDKDGFQDIYMANDKYVTENILYRNNGDGTFENVSAASGTNLIMGAMCTAIDDYNNDGWLDIYVSNDNQVIPNTTTGNALLQNNGDGTFTNVAISSGTQYNSVGWSSVFLDADNDTDHDLYVSGNGDGLNGSLPSAFYENAGNGTFSIPVKAGFENDTRQSYSNAIGDVDNDGYPEIVVINDGNLDVFLWKNLCPSDNNWLKVKLEGVQSNRMGIGSWIEIGVGENIQYNYTLCGEGYLGQNSAYEFFGLGTETIVDYIKVSWLSGEIDYIENVGINQAITIIEGSNPLSIEDVIKTASFKFFPNPANNILTFSQENKTELLLTFFDLSGKKVMNAFVSEKNTQLDVSRFSAGVYMIQIVSPKKNTQTLKLIIQ